MYALNMMRIALELAMHNDVYESTASKFFEHFLFIAEAMTDMGGEGLRALGRGRTNSTTTNSIIAGRPHASRCRVRSMVGLVPLFAVEVIDPGMLQRLPDFARRMNWVLEQPASSGEARVALDRGRRRRPQAPVTPAGPPHEGPPAAACWTRAEFLSPLWHPLAFQGPPGSALLAATNSAPPSRSGTTRRNPPPTCSAATRTGAVRSGCR